MRSALQLLGGVAVAGVVATGSTAFTAAGLTTASTAASPQYFGGTATQTVVGATLNTVNYTISAGKITGVSLVFADDNSDSKAVTAVPAGSSFSGDAADHFDCSAVVAGTDTSTCTVVKADNSASTGGYTTTGMTGLAITVAN